MNTHQKIIAGFTIIVTLMTMMGAIATFTTLRMTATFMKIHAHPYSVIKAAKNININMLLIQRDMRNVLFTKNPGEVNAMLNAVKRYEQDIADNFQILFDRYLGDIGEIQQFYDTFIEWKMVGQEVIKLVKAGRREEVESFLKEKSPVYSAALNESMEKVMAFAEEMASELHRSADREEKISLAIIIILAPITILIALAIAIYITKIIRKGEHELAHYLHLVDQNVLICSLDKKGCVKEISNALCRLLGYTKEDIINKQCDFFIEETDKRLLERIMRTLETGKKWEGTFKKMDAQGNELWIHSTILPVFNELYAITGYNNIIENITDKKIIEALSLTDGLTGLHNRRYYEDNIDQVIKTAQREKHYLTLALLDIDFFKRYNDNYGHPAGDQVLFQVANVFRNHLHRPTDHCMRVGGEEFCIVFTGSNVKKSTEFLEEIRAGIEALKIKHEYNDAHPFVTVSAGAVVSFGRDIPDKEALYRKADEALYEAKKTRNTLVVT